MTKEEEKIIKKISYYVIILKEFIRKKKQTRKIENGLVKWIKTNQEIIKKMNSY